MRILTEPPSWLYEDTLSWVIVQMPSTGPETQQVLSKAPFPSLRLAPRLCVGQGAGLGYVSPAPARNDPCLFLGPVSERQERAYLGGCLGTGTSRWCTAGGLCTWRSGSLHRSDWSHGFSLWAWKETEEQAASGWISVPMLRALQPPSGQGHVCQVCWAQFKCLLVPLPTPLATGLSFLIFIMDSMTAPVFQACCEDYMA